MPQYEMIQVLPGDIFFTRGYSLFSKLIRFNETTWDDEIAIVNHVGIVVEPGPLYIANAVEALRHVQKHTIFSQYHGEKDKVSIFRPLGLQENDIFKITNKALTYIGKDYGYLKILGHTLDYFTGGHYIFRRFFNSDNYPICSWVVAHAYKAAGLMFGCDPGMATPDDIWDYCLNNKTKYTNILHLTRI